MLLRAVIGSCTFCAGGGIIGRCGIHDRLLSIAKLYVVTGEMNFDCVTLSTRIECAMLFPYLLFLPEVRPSLFDAFAHGVIR